MRKEGTKDLDISQDYLNEIIDENSQAVPFLYAFPLTQNRRVRSDEIHYFDHPKMGMILQIRKMEQPINRTNETTSISMLN